MSQFVDDLGIAELRFYPTKKACSSLLHPECKEKLSKCNKYCFPFDTPVPDFDLTYKIFNGVPLR